VDDDWQAQINIIHVMTHSSLGSTNLSVSRLSLGGAQFGQQYGPLSVRQAHEVVVYAADAGINLIDTSAFYGEGTSERILGEVLVGGLREKFHICTKAGRLGRDRFDFSAKGMKACLDESLQRLRTDRVEILLAHDIEYATDYEQVFNETYRAMQDIQQSGKARYIGMSCYPLGLLKQAIERCQLDVVISYCHFNMQNTLLLTELLPVAERRGTGVMNASPLAMGLLTQQGPPPWHPAEPEIHEACRRASMWCKEHGLDISRVAMQFCLAENRIPTTITGASTVAELQTNIAAIEEPLDANVLSELKKILASVHNRTWPSGNWKFN
jgi:L-galactose dehydrogenase